MAQDVSNANMTSMLLRSILSSWYARITLLAMLAAGAGAVYWYRDSISLTAASVEESVISSLGLGVVTVALWLVVFAFAIFVQQSLFRHYRLWLASPIFIGFLSRLPLVLRSVPRPLRPVHVGGRRNPRGHGRLRHSGRDHLARRPESGRGLGRRRRNRRARSRARRPLAVGQRLLGNVHFGDERRRCHRSHVQVKAEAR